MDSWFSSAAPSALGVTSGIGTWAGSGDGTASGWGKDSCSASIRASMGSVGWTVTLDGSVGAGAGAGEGSDGAGVGEDGAWFIATGISGVGSSAASTADSCSGTVPMDGGAGSAAGTRISGTLPPLRSSSHIVSLFPPPKYKFYNYLSDMVIIDVLEFNVYIFA